MLSKIFKYSGNLLYKIAGKIEPQSANVVNSKESLLAFRASLWFRDNGDKNHRLFYD